jgi:hypothetical protein
VGEKFGGNVGEYVEETAVIMKTGKGGCEMERMRGRSV